MPASVLARYLDAATLGRLVQTRLDPRSLVMGHLAGSHRSPVQGFAVEFAGYREYMPGDDLRHLDWRMVFNRGKYFIKQYEMETNWTSHFVFDTSASMQYGEGWEQKAQVALQMLTLLAYAVIRQADRASLTMAGARIDSYLPPSDSMAQLVRMLELLDSLSYSTATNLPACLIEMASRWQQRELVVILSDFFLEIKEIEAAIERLRYSRHEVVLVEVLHQDERTFDFQGAVRFKGLEGLAAYRTVPTEIRDAYLDAMRAHQQALTEMCHRHQVEYLPLTTNQDLAGELIAYLNRRQRTRRR
ncbi:DUF58 domain-containing protein [Planctomycetales bacterium 10988]|nr:DUF58 domain-containing protein [Planctomycetales bacterium 10988]